MTVAIPFKAWPEFAQKYGAILMQKIVIDTTNTNRERDGAIVDRVVASGSGTLLFVAALLPGARLVKAFNTMESDTLAKGANQPNGPLAHPIAGDDQAARDVAALLVRDAGFEAVITGDAATAATFDQGTPVWNHPRNAIDLATALAI